jgi:hypothetical protein
MGWTGSLEGRGEKRDAYRILVGKAKGKKPLERPRYRWRILFRRIRER